MFSSQVHAKCILAGEHTVMRGGSAIVVPLPNFFMTLEFLPTDQPLTLLMNDHAWDEGLQVLSSYQIKGAITIKTNVPIAAGLGASAMLAVLYSRLLSHLQILDSSEVLKQALEFEATFHGKQTSGVDVHAVLSANPLHFQKGEVPQEILIKKAPYLCLSYSGEPSLTAKDIQKVREFCDKNRDNASKVDEKMQSSVNAIKIALASDNQNLLKEGIEWAHECFQAWSLISEGMQVQIDKLKQAGAIAVKPTGSGGGGFILSLWPEDILLAEKNLPFPLIPVFTKDTNHA